MSFLTNKFLTHLWPVIYTWKTSAYEQNTRRNYKVVHKTDRCRLELEQFIRAQYGLIRWAEQRPVWLRRSSKQEPFHQLNNKHSNSRVWLQIKQYIEEGQFVSVQFSPSFIKRWSFVYPLTKTRIITTITITVIKYATSSQ